MIRQIGVVLRETFTPDLVKWRQAFEPLSDAQRWALAAGAQLTELRRECHDTLNPEPTSRVAAWRSDLEGWWHVTTRAELLASLDWLTTTGHRSAFRAALGHEAWAWDLVRAINLIRWGYGAQYLGRDEAWPLIAGVAPRLAARYPSWAAMAQDYLLAHEVWAGHADPKLNLVTQRLLAPANIRSPWRQMPWSFMTPPQEDRSDPSPGEMSL